MNQTFGSPWDNYHKWRRKAYEETYGPGSWEGKARENAFNEENCVRLSMFL